MIANLHRAAVARRFGPPEVLQIEDVATRGLAPGQVRVAARYSGLNPVDARIRAGTFGGSVPFQPGTEFLGEVVEIGPGVGGFELGDIVAGFGTPASNSDLITSLASNLVAVSDPSQLVTKAGVGAVGMTAITVLDSLSLRPGSRIIVHGGAGGVGSIFTQLAVAGGHTVVVTASPSNQEHVREIGATPVTYGPGLQARLDEISPDGFDAAVDMVGTREAGDNAASVRAAGGRAVTIVPETTSSHALPLVQVRRTPQNLQRLHQEVQTDTLKLPTEAIPFENIVDAHRRLDEGHARGKIVLDHINNPYLTRAELREEN